jgi:protein-disulfide isomerase
MEVEMFAKAWWCILPAILSAQTQSQPRAATADQVSELAAQVKSLSVAQQRIEKEISAIFDVLSGKRPPLENVFVGVSGHPSLGSVDSALVMVEFTDFQCPFCGEFARTTFPRILADYVSNGKMRYVIRNFPLEDSHPFAKSAAEAGLCAQQQGKFWALHDYFFAHQDQIGTEGALDKLTAAGLDPGTMQRCINSGTSTVDLEQDMAEGRELGITGTPTFFLGYIDQSDPARMRAVRSILGGAPLREFQSAIEQTIKYGQQNRGDH